MTGKGTECPHTTWESPRAMPAAHWTGLSVTALGDLLPTSTTLFPEAVMVGPGLGCNL